jgi:hypothetical protein
MEDTNQMNDTIQAVVTEAEAQVTVQQTSIEVQLKRKASQRMSLLQ